MFLLDSCNKSERCYYPLSRLAHPIASPQAYHPKKQLFFLPLFLFMNYEDSIMGELSLLNCNGEIFTSYLGHSNLQS